MKHLFNTTTCPTKEQLEGYLHGNDSQEARFRIENHLLDCELCSTAVEGYTAMGYTAEDAAFLNSFTADLVKKKEEAIVKPLKSNRDRFLWRRIAAAVLVLAIPLSSYLYWQDTETDRLTQEYFEILAINSEFRGVENLEGIDADLNHAVANYKKKNFEASIPQFETYLEREPENVQAILYTGIACLESGQIQKADDLLTTVRINSERLFEDSTWYLVLAKIKADKTDDAIELLEELVKKNELGFYAEKAKKLLEELKKK